MSKKFLSLLLAFCLILSATALAFASMQENYSDSDLYYIAGNIKCNGFVTQDGAMIDLTMKLSRNGRTVRTWNMTGFDAVQMFESYPAVSGSTYQLSFVCYIDGILTSVPSKTLVCP